MRLIDADVMHREIDKYDPEGRMSLKNIKRYIDAQPTAYDTDKVIEQFKECSFRDPYGYGDDLIDIGYAIEIVKDGCEPRKNLQELKLIGRQSEWIPVSERLPENAQHKGAFCPRYQVTTKYGVTEGWYNPDKESWYVLFWFMTKRFYVIELNEEFGFTLDPCSTDDNHLCDKYYTMLRYSIEEERRTAPRLNRTIKGGI